MTYCMAQLTNARMPLPGYPFPRHSGLRSHAAPYWATLHPLNYATLYLATLQTSELRCTLLSYTAHFWATLHPTKLRLTLLSNAAPSELRCTLPSYAYTLLSDAANYWATLHTTESRSPLWQQGEPAWFMRKWYVLLLERSCQGLLEQILWVGGAGAPDEEGEGDDHQDHLQEHWAHPLAKNW